MKKTYTKPSLKVIPIHKEPIIASSGSTDMSYGDIYDQEGAIDQFSLDPDDNVWGIDWHSNDKE